jgi:predicted nucleic acid-binding protein
MAGGRVVVDASALAGLVLPDEDGLAIAQMLASAVPVAPQLIWAEIRNLLLMAERRGRIGAGVVEQALAAIGDLGLVLDVGAGSDRVMDLARRHRLTVYDALYLELALREALPLASADRALIRAAAAEGVVTV